MFLFILSEERFCIYTVGRRFLGSMCYCTVWGDFPCHSVKLKSMKNKVCVNCES